MGLFWSLQKISQSKFGGKVVYGRGFPLKSNWCQIDGRGRNLINPCYNHFPFFLILTHSLSPPLYVTIFSHCDFFLNYIFTHICENLSLFKKLFSHICENNWQYTMYSGSKQKSAFSALLPHIICWKVVYGRSVPP